VPRSGRRREVALGDVEATARIDRGHVADVPERRRQRRPDGDCPTVRLEADAKPGQSGDARPVPGLQRTEYELVEAPGMAAATQRPSLTGATSTARQSIAAPLRRLGGDG
jgi:hypothetical protein